MDTLEFDGQIIPSFQAQGNAAQFALPFAKHMCKGRGLDIGGNNSNWAMPGAKLIDLELDDEWNAFNLPDNLYDYIFSSHCLEHLPDWVGALDYWGSRLDIGGVMFLYLPHYEQKYWRPWNNRKHVNVLTPEFIRDYFEARDYDNIIVTEGYDLNHSFYAIAENTCVR
jgi:SAM-dependent methyltransferase